MRKILYVECGKYKFNASDPGVDYIEALDIPGDTDERETIIRVFHNDGSFHVIRPKNDAVVLKLSAEIPDIVVPEIIIDPAS